MISGAPGANHVRVYQENDYLFETKDSYLKGELMMIRNIIILITN